MLTDRQEKFLTRMVDLYQHNSSITVKERVELEFVIRNIRRGEKFQITINRFNFRLRNKLNKKKLTKDLEFLVKDLISVYGEPTDPYDPKDIGPFNPGWLS